MNKENKITVNSLLSALLFLVFGIILLNKTDDIISIASKFIGAFLVIFGIIKLVKYIYMKGKEGNYNLSELLLGLVGIGFGTILILCSSALSFAIRVCVGAWIVFSGINRIILALSVRAMDKVGSRTYLITAIIMFIIGLLIISGVFDEIIGLFIIIYSLIEIVDYIYYRVKGKNYEFNNDSKSEEKKSSIKKLKSGKVVDAIIEEENN